MDWLHPKLLLLAIPALLLLFWFDALSTHPMSMQRRRWLLIVRTLLVILALLCLASPARVLESRQQSAIFVLDHSRSEGEEGIKRVYEAARKIADDLPGDISVGYVAAGSDAEVMRYPDGDGGRVPPEELLIGVEEPPRIERNTLHDRPDHGRAIGSQGDVEE